MADEADIAGEGYQVLARKHRPQTFADLIGQEAMVRTLRNAFAHDRIHHAFIMTGVRGVGKTTTARIIAKGLNCVGPDGTGGPTISPCGSCEPCRQIAESRHVDVLEMDAASRTGVGDIREIIESVRYRAASARYKVYIIDEVHMLSTSAFNALLKTLEEPPEHVKFIFATTEIRKVPVTVLSRCQRFDLRRIEPEVMIDFLAGVAAKEKVEVAPEALALITRAAEGSARDALSLLDQAISHGTSGDGAGRTEAEEVRAMLGLADRGRIIDLFETIMKGDAAAALTEIGAQYADGADPVAVLRDLAELTHWISVVKINPEHANDPTVSTDERDRGRELAERLQMRALTRMWQMLLKALEEVSSAPNAMMAAEMAVIRLTHVADLPTPEEIVRQLSGGPDAPSPGGGPAGPGNGPSGGPGGGPRAATSGGAAVSAAPAAAPAPRPEPAPRANAEALVRYETFADVVALIIEKRDAKLRTDVEDFVRIVAYQPGRIEFSPAPRAPADLAQTLAAKLSAWTGARWMVSVSSAPGEPTVTERRRAAEDEARRRAAEHPLVAAALSAFPGARIVELRDLAATAEAPPPPPEDGDDDLEDDDYGDDWSPVDPFSEQGSTDMFKGLGDMGKLMKQAQEMQSKMTEAQERLGSIEVEGEAGAGMVKAIATARGDLKRLDIDPSLFNPDDKEVVEDLIVAAVKDAQEKAAETAQSEMAKVTEGLPLPPGMKLPF